MVTSRSRVASPNAARYLGQLCKHFAYKITVDFAPEAEPPEGLAHFPWGTCAMRATGDHLEMTIEAASAEEATRVAAVVDDHLKRFAWREDLTIAWTQANP